MTKRNVTPMQLQVAEHIIVSHKVRSKTLLSIVVVALVLCTTLQPVGSFHCNLRN